MCRILICLTVLLGILFITLSRCIGGCLELFGALLLCKFLESYKSVTLESMASAFGVSVDFIDKELVDFIVAGRLPAKIDKVQTSP